MFCEAGNLVYYRGENEGMTSLFDAAIAGGQPRETLPPQRPHVLICTPCHSGKVDLNYHISMTYATNYLLQQGINFTLDFNIGMNIDWARSQMATRFLENPEYTHLLFVDDDMAFAADLPFRLLCENLDVVAVPYRRKQRAVKFNIRHGVRVETIPGRPYLAGVDSIATGMMMIQKQVIEKLADKVPEFLYTDRGDKGRLFFRHQLVDDEMVGGVSYMGEDYYFCKLVRDNGMKVWAYVDEPIAHIGTYAFEGNYKEWAEKGSSVDFSYAGPRQPLRLITV